MPDMKYADTEAGRKLSRVRDYPARNREAVLEMHRQVGDLIIDDTAPPPDHGGVARSLGLARRGLLVRHLVLPGDLAGTREIARFLAREVSPDTYINLHGPVLPSPPCRALPAPGPAHHG